MTKEEGQEPEPSPGTEKSDVDAMIKQLVKTAVEDVEIKLGQQIEAVGKQIESMGKEIGTSLGPMVDGAITAKLPGIVDQLGELFQAKQQERADDAAGNPEGSAPAATDGTKGNSAVGRLVSQLTVPDVIDIIKLWKEPSSGEAIAASFKTWLGGFTSGQRVKAGEFIKPEEIGESLGIPSSSLTK